MNNVYQMPKHPRSGEPWLVLRGHSLQSRLLVGIEQYDSVPLVRDVLKTTGSQVFITTVDPDNRGASLLLMDLADALPLEEYLWIGTTSFARSAESALKSAHILRGAYGIEIIKLDVRTDQNRPDNEQTVVVAEQLRNQGMDVLPFILPDVKVARRLQDLGCAAIRVMASPVASGRGIVDTGAVLKVIEACEVPVVVEGGLGTARHVTLAMELGAAAVLINTALVKARYPLLMASAMRHAVEAGRLAFESRPMNAALAA